MYGGKKFQTNMFWPYLRNYVIVVIVSEYRIVTGKRFQTEQAHLPIFSLEQTVALEIDDLRVLKISK